MEATVNARISNSQQTTTKKEEESCTALVRNSTLIAVECVCIIVSMTLCLAKLFCGVVFLALFDGSVSSYVNGAAQKSYEKGDELMVKVNWLTSRNQVPYSYYSLPYCRPGKYVHTVNDMKEVLFGGHSEVSFFAFKMLEAERCHVVCRLKLNAKSAKEFKEKIDDGYRVQMMVDELPLVTAQMTFEEGPPVYQPGFLVGLLGHYVGEQEYRAFIHNHLTFTVKYNKDLHSNSTNIVGFEVKPSSVHHKYEGTWNKETPLTTCAIDKGAKALLSNSPHEVKDDEEIIFTYDVQFQESVVKWSSRWDATLVQRNHKGQWFNTLSSFFAAILLSGKVVLILSRTLRSDISIYTTELESEETQEETGWKAVHGDVFRTPSNANLFCICIGTGVQVFGTTMGVLIVSNLNLLPHSNQNGLLSAMLLIWAFMGIFAGYTCSRLHCMFRGTVEWNWNITALTTAVTFPAAIFVILSAINAILCQEKSPAAIPFVTLVNLFIFEYTISAPAVTIGTFTGFKMPAIINPNPPRKIPREIPIQAWYQKPVIWTLLGGMMTFSAIFGELVPLLVSISTHRLYNSYHSLLLAFVLMIIICAVSSITICYNQLCKENYHWWWSSFLTGGSSAMYFSLHVMYYLIFRLRITKMVPLAVSLGYVLIAACAFFFMAGAIGFLACFWFTRLIYSSLKID